MRCTVCHRHKYAHHWVDDHSFAAPTPHNLLSSQRVGAGNPNAALTEEQVTEILCTRASAFALARKFGVSRSTVSRVRSGLSWSEFTPPPPHVVLYRKGGRNQTGMRAKVRAKKLPPGAPRLKRPSEVKG